jgi:hypothetical protein
VEKEQEVVEDDYNLLSAKDDNGWLVTIIAQVTKGKGGADMKNNAQSADNECTK